LVFHPKKRTEIRGAQEQCVEENIWTEKEEEEEETGENYKTTGFISMYYSSNIRPIKSI
jgi:hypothetical protein